MRRIDMHLRVVLFAIFWVSFQGCATEPVSLRIEKTLPQDKLAYYNDSFDTLREDLWERAGFTFSPAQMGNFKMALMAIEEGKLRIDTQTGGFSKGGFVSKYKLRGDFDVQLDCHIDFVEGLQDMDQLLGFSIVEREEEGRGIRSVNMGVVKEGGRDRGVMVSNYRERGTFHPGNWRPTRNFHGTLRIVRIGDRINTLYKQHGEEKWRKMDTFPSTTDDAVVGFGLQNFVVKRNFITARSSITAWFDNFRINAAQEIIESEI